MKILEPRYYEQKEYTKYSNLVKRSLKRLLKMPVIGRTAIQKDFLLDVDKMYPLADLVEYLTKCKYKTTLEYIKAIDKWLELEQVTYNYPFPLAYKVGKMEDVVTLILSHHMNLSQRQ